MKELSPFSEGFDYLKKRIFVTKQQICFELSLRDSLALVACIVTSKTF